MKRAVHLATWLFCLSMAGCGAPVVPPMSLGDSALSAQGADLKDEDVFALVRLLSGENGQAAHLDPAKIRKANKTLSTDKPLRDKAYKVADPIIYKVFSRPGKTDAVPPLSAQDMQTLKASLQPGDVIQCGNDGSFIHGVFYVGNDVIIHALAETINGKPMVGVIKETLTGYFDRVDRDTVVVLRPQWTPGQLKTGIAYAQAQVGKGYDSLFLTESADRFYCTELVYKTLTIAKVARIQPRYVKDAWPIVMNEEIRQSPDLKVVYTKNHS
ncbi:MAG: hypothetical protein H7338_15035 [Candidatus Sericytochromatia bacterium]|nr:hypothetical protein [Candidatus Sericytochromatia bacterium]